MRRRYIFLFCCWGVLGFKVAQAQELSSTPQKLQALYTDIQAKQADLTWKWEMSRAKIQQKRLEISRIFARAYSLKWISSLQKRYGGDKTLQQKAYLWLILRRSLLKEALLLQAETQNNKVLESEKNRLNEAARSFYFYTQLQKP